MRLHALHLTDFRSYATAVFQPQGKRCLILGPNGSGKTNLLEAVGTLSLGRSIIGVEDIIMMRWGAPAYRLRAEVESDSGERITLEVGSAHEPKRQRAFLRNDVRGTISSFVGLLPTVTFLPQDLALFTGPPAERRRFLDQLLCQVSPAYLQALSGYQKALRQRNALLRQVSDGLCSPDDLRVWEEALATHGAEVTVERLALIETFNLALQRELQSLEAPWAQTTVAYERRGTARNPSDLQAEISALLLEHRPRDIAACSTSVGPHRDDWRAVVDQRDLATSASRGEQRLCLLALLSLQVSYLELQRGEKAVILLDDIFSELDPAHQRAVLGILSDHQILLTATHVPSGITLDEVWEIGEGGLARQAARTPASRRGTAAVTAP
jgi:DNA replication and repair protein RecF